jgi:hypothetical protein
MKKILIATIAIVAFSLFMTQINNIDTENVEIEDRSIVPTYFVESSWNMESMSRHAEYIVIGRVIDYYKFKYKFNEYINEPHAIVQIEIEQELTNNYDDKIISYRSMDYGWIEPDDRVLVFISEKDPNSIWGDNYYLMGGPNGLYKIIGGKVYGQDLREGLELDNVIDNINKYREERLKGVIQTAKYIVIGNITSIERLSDENQFAIITARVEEDLLNNYSNEEIQFFTYDVRRWDGRWDEYAIGKKYLLAIKWDEDKDNYITPHNKYKIIGNMAYGAEYYNGIELDTLKLKIAQYKSI